MEDAGAVNSVRGTDYLLRAAFRAGGAGAGGVRERVLSGADGEWESDAGWWTGFGWWVDSER